jgi:prepilin-type N-terminal cleavage/methylation domain-containing protein
MSTPMKHPDPGRGGEPAILRNHGNMRDTTHKEGSRGKIVRRVARYTPCPFPGNARGFTAIELITVLVALAVLAAVYMALQRPSEMIPVEVAAQQLVTGIARVRDEAAAAEAEALIAVLPDGRYAVQTGPAGSLSLPTIPAEEWEALPEGLVWGAGSATTNPLGQPVAPLPAQVYCDADGSCDVPDLMAIYLIRSRREPHRVAAITLGQNGAVQSWRWEPGTARWKPSAR